MVIITHLIRILGKHSKRVRKWYYKRTGNALWGVGNYLIDKSLLFNESLEFQLKSIEKITGVNIYEFELGEEWTIPPGSWEWIED